jgi:hypothetical protein
MNALTTTQSSTPAKPTSPELSPELKALLDEPGSPDAAVVGIASLPALVEEAKRVLPALRAVAEAKAGREGVKAVIGRRLATYPQPQRTEGEWDAWWADYFDVLEDVTLASLEAGMRAYVALPDSEFMPKPGQLRELAFTAPCRSLTRLHRATLAIRRAEECRERTPEEIAEAAALAEANRAEIARLAAEFKSKSIPESPKRPVLPSISGQVDERGITQAMRDLMARRQAEA